MANHKSALKRIRQTKTRTLHNRYYAKTMRNAVRKLRALTDKEEVKFGCSRCKPCLISCYV